MAFMLEWLTHSQNDGQRGLIATSVLGMKVKALLSVCYDKEQEAQKKDAGAQIHPSMRGVEILANKTKKIVYIDSGLLNMLSKTSPPKSCVINKFLCPELLVLFPLDNTQGIVATYFFVARGKIYHYSYHKMTPNGASVSTPLSMGHITLNIPINEEYPVLVAETDDSYQVNRKVDFSSHWIVNFLLWQQSMHDKGQDVIKLDTPTRKMGFGKNSKQLTIPCVIGEGYNPKVIRNYESKGTHSSPTTHWRSGHWRQQPFGKKEDQTYKTIWIEPILVNP